MAFTVLHTGSSDLPGIDETRKDKAYHEKALVISTRHCQTQQIYLVQ